MIGVLAFRSVFNSVDLVTKDLSGWMVVSPCLVNTGLEERMVTCFGSIISWVMR